MADDSILTRLRKRDQSQRASPESLIQDHESQTIKRSVIDDIPLLAITEETKTATGLMSTQ